MYALNNTNIDMDFDTILVNSFRNCKDAGSLHSIFEMKFLIFRA